MSEWSADSVSDRDELCRCLHSQAEHVDNPSIGPWPFCLTCAALPLAQRSAPHNHAFTPPPTGPTFPANEDHFPARWWELTT